jgi:regulator of replication initiation timing
MTLAQPTRDGHPWIGDMLNEMARLRAENKALRAENLRLREQLVESDRSPDWSLD